MLLSSLHGSFLFLNHQGEVLGSFHPVFTCHEDVFMLLMQGFRAEIVESEVLEAWTVLK